LGLIVLHFEVLQTHGDQGAVQGKNSRVAMANEECEPLAVLVLRNLRAFHVVEDLCENV
jgi:hypothetical protein